MAVRLVDSTTAVRIGNLGAPGTTTVSFACQDGTHRVLVVGALARNADTCGVAAVTYDGAALTRDVYQGVYTSGVAGFWEVSLWHLEEADFPATSGARDVVVTYDDTTLTARNFVVQFAGVRSGGPTATALTKTAYAANIASTAVVSVAGSWTVECEADVWPYDVRSPGSGQTEIADATSSEYLSGVIGYREIASATTAVLRWDFSESLRAGLVAAVFAPYEATYADGVGTATGSSTVTGIGAATACGVGSAAGSSTCTGVGDYLGTVTAVANASGSSTVVGVGAATATGTGTAAGAASVAGIGAAIACGVGTAAGSSTCTGVGSYIVTYSAADLVVTLEPWPSLVVTLDPYPSLTVTLDAAPSLMVSL